MEPGFIHSPLMKLEHPIATTRISAIRQISLKFCVSLWQIVTVASFHFNKFAIGVPTKLLRPITTANFLLMHTPVDFISSKHAFGVP